MELIPIHHLLADNLQKPHDHEYQQVLVASVNYYTVIGFHPPWICYLVSDNNQLVGSAGFKGRPVNKRVEIAYGTFERFRNKGYGAKTCRLLVDTALKTDSTIIVTARTLPEENHSTKILRSNSFSLIGTVEDPDDGTVWEWVYAGPRL